MTSYQNQTSWAPDGDGQWTHTLDPSWAQGRATFGGVVTGAALKAMRTLVGQERLPRAAQTQFYGPVGPAPVTLRAEVVRAGRALTAVEAHVYQGGKRRASVQASFGAARDSGLVVVPPPHPQMLPAEDTIELPFLPGVTPAFTQHFAYRWEGGRYPFSGASEPVTSGWCKHRQPSDDPYVDIVGLLDAWPAPLLTMADRPVPASTVSWTASFVDVSTSAADGWWYFRADPVHSARGYATTRGHLYAPDGRLAAHMEQLVVIFDR